MNVEEIQKRLNAMSPRLAAKMKPEPEATIMLRSDREVTGMIQWREEKNGFHHQWSHHDGASVSEILDNMDAWIAALPSPEEAKRERFTKALANAIETGRECGIDLEYVNPLVEAMKRLSENCITYQETK